MVVIFMIGLVKLFIVGCLLLFPFKMIDAYFNPEKVTEGDDIQLGTLTENDGFFMAAMYQDMGNDL